MPGTISATNSTISMSNGAAGDVLTLGGLALNNATLAVDVNQSTAQADQLVTGVLTTAGTNVVAVNLLGVPLFTTTTNIPIITSGGAPAGTFAASGLPGTQASLFTYQLV
jgi:outer membrane autotransporter protein